MGGKWVGPGKQIYLYIVIMMFLSGSGCALLSRSPAPAETAANGAPPPAVAVPEDDALTHLALGRKLFAGGDYRGALKEDELAATLAADGPVAEEALFSMGLIYAYPANPARDPAKSAACFRKLVKGHPAGTFAEEARVLLAILHEHEQSARTIRRLQAIIRETKQTDMRIEDKRAKAQ